LDRAGKSEEGDHNENAMSDTRIKFDAYGDRRDTGAVAARQWCPSLSRISSVPKPTFILVGPFEMALLANSITGVNLFAPI
jgi:hypothetical protein